MYAIIEEGGRQHKVTAGDMLDIDREITGEEKTITLDRVLLVAGEGAPRIGTPTVAGASVTAEIVGPVKGPKIQIVKHRRRKHYDRRTGHRQHYTRVKVTAINV